MTPDALRQLAKPVAMQTALFGAIGAGVLVLRKLTKTPLHPLVSARPELARHPVMAHAASRFADLGDEAAFVRLLDKLEAIASLDAVRLPATQWKISRMSADVVRDAESMCARAPVVQSNDAFRAVLTCRDEAIPQLQSELDNLLHNHLLACSFMG